MKQRVFVTSDTHGCLEQLISCLDQANFDYDNDKLIHCGDIVDRGPDSKGVVDLLLRIKNKVCIRGNHDYWWLQYIVMNHQAPHLMAHMTQGGMQTVQSYSPDGSTIVIPEEHKQFFKEQVTYYEDEQGRFFTHAGYDRWERVEEQEETVFAWDRELMRDIMACSPLDTLNDVNLFTRVFIGHTPTVNWKEKGELITTPIYKGKYVQVDTGGCYGGKISLIDITDDDAHILYQASISS